MLSISETLDTLAAEESALVARIAGLNKESVATKLLAARGDGVALKRRTQILGELQTANQDLADTRAAIVEARPLVAIERLEDQAHSARALSKSIADRLALRTGLAERVDTLVAELASAVKELELRYSEAQRATTRVMNPMEAMQIGWDHEQVAQAVIGNLLRLASWDESVLSNLSSHGLSLLRQVEPIAEVVERQGTMLLAVRQREEDKIAERIDHARQPADAEAEQA